MSQPCQKCKKREATRHESVRAPDGSWQEVHLCDSCAGGDVTLLTPASFVQQLMGAAAQISAGPRTPAQARACPKCGITYAEFRSRGRFGCPHDYEVFQPEMLPLLERIHHGGAQHVGKSPASTDGRSAAERELIELRRALAEAVQRERYEDAARLRDRIQVLEGDAPEAAPPEGAEKGPEKGTEPEKGRRKGRGKGK